MSNELLSQSNLPAHIAEFRSYPRPKTFEDILVSRCPKIPAFARKHGIDKVEDIVFITLSSISEGLAFPINSTMLMEATQTIVEDWPDTRMDDFLLFKKEFLAGRIGGNTKHDLYRWDTRTIIMAWDEYYQKMMNMVCDKREEQIKTDHIQYEDGYGKSYAKLSQESKDKIHKSMTALSEKMSVRNILENEKINERIELARNKTKSIEDIAFEEGIEMEIISECIIKAATKQKIESKSDAPIGVFIAKVMAEVTYNAKQDPESLRKFIETI